MEKVITLYRCDFTDEQWDAICDEFEVDTNRTFIMCVVDLNTI